MDVIRNGPRRLVIDTASCRSSGMKIVGTQDLANYPFLAETKQYMADLAITLDDLANPEFDKIIEKAFGRIVVSISGQVYKESDNTTNEILSFVIATLLLKSAKSQPLINKFCLQEAIRSEKHLEKEVEREPESFFMVVKIIEDLFGMTIKMGQYRGSKEFLITIPEYLKRAVKFHDKSWKLVNRNTYGGYVHLDGHDVIRLVRNELVNYIMNRIQVMPEPSLPDNCKPVIQRLVDIGKQFSWNNPVVSNDTPPCVQHGIDALKKGENLPHTGRFLLAALLASRGQTVDQISELFKTAPDYNERVTRYQVENVINRKYKAPSCEKLRTEGLCFAVADCNNIINPVQFKKSRNS